MENLLSFDQIETLKVIQGISQDVKRRKMAFPTVADVSNYRGTEMVLETNDGREYVAKPTSTETINDVTVIERALGGRYIWNPDTFVNADVFGIVGDGVTDDTIALQRAATISSTKGLTVIFGREMTCKVTSTITKAQSFNGLNWFAPSGKVTLDYSTMAANSICLKIKGGSGDLCNSVVEGFIFKGNSTSTAVEIAGQCGQRIVRCRFKDNRYGVVFHNESAAEFTEWCTIEYCNFLQECKTAYRYKRTAPGDQISFHGSGSVGINFVNADGVGGASVIQVDNGCLPYNAPLNLQVWTLATLTLIQNNNITPSFYTPWFVGVLTLEPFSGTVTLGGGHRIAFAGPITSNRAGVSSGSLLRCEKVIYTNNATQIFGINWSTVLTLTTASTTVTTFAKQGTFLAFVKLITTNYDYRYLLVIDHSGDTQAATVTTLATLRQFNVNTWGAPTFSADSQGQLIINHASFAGQSVKAEITLKQVADFVHGSSPAEMF